jgi:uncharacterized protein (DUF488 family)
VRGPEYAWANSVRLQDSLGSAGVDYAHHPELAPTTELRHLQYEEDARQKVGKRSRVVLEPRYVERYQHEILARVDLGPLAASMPWAGATALFCVERDPEACHRSLIAARLADEYGCAVRHLLPE